MNTLKRIPSCLAMIAAVAIVVLPVIGGAAGWRERLYDPAIFLTALTLAGVATVLWPLDPQPIKYSRSLRRRWQQVGGYILRAMRLAGANRWSV